MRREGDEFCAQMPPQIQHAHSGPQMVPEPVQHRIVMQLHDAHLAKRGLGQRVMVIAGKPALRDMAHRLGMGGPGADKAGCGRGQGQRPVPQAAQWQAQMPLHRPLQSPSALSRPHAAPSAKGRIEYRQYWPDLPKHIGVFFSASCSVPCGASCRVSCGVPFGTGGMSWAGGRL